ncbi:uncharacterized protein [Hetaerina americana]|uniref:uncharacterized protein n=1 Tax=Hetaerina americana TaxID=62018 RepID=UPI003A7F3DA5
MDNLCGISRSLYGQPWSSWCTSKELESEEDTSDREQIQPVADVMRLPKEDMTLFGFCPEQDDFYIVICELCGLGIKPMGMTHHMNLRHSKGEETIKNATNNKILSKECDVKPKNRKHISSASIVSDYGHAVGPPQKVLPSEAPPVSIAKTEHHPETPPIRPTVNSKINVEAEKINKISTSTKNHSKQYNLQDANVVLDNSINLQLPLVKSSRSSKSVHIDGVKPSKTVYKAAVPIRAGFRLQLVGTTNCILYKRNSKSAVAATTELKVRHRRRHRRSRSSHRSKVKSRIAKRCLPVLVRASISSSPVASSPSLAPLPYVALTPLKAVKWNNNAEGVPSHLKPSISSHPPGAPCYHGGPGMPVSKGGEGVMQMLSVDTSSNHGVKPELRVPLLSCKSTVPIRNHVEIRMKHSIVQGNTILVPRPMPQLPIRVPDVSWSPVHPKSLGVCPLQIRKVGGLISSDRRLDCVWQYMKSALFEQETYQTTVLCSANSSQPDLHLNHKPSIKTIFASLSANNCSRNSVSKPSNLGLRQIPLSLNNEKPISSSLRGVIDVSSVMLISPNHSKDISDQNSFLSHTSKPSSVVKRSPSCITTQPYPGIFLRNGQHIFPRHLRVSLKRRKPAHLSNHTITNQNEKNGEEKLENCVSPNEFDFTNCVPVLQFPIPNGLPDQVNNFESYPEEGLPQVVPQSDIELDVNSLGMITRNGESLCEATRRLSGLDHLKSDLMSGLHSLKSASRIMDATNKPSCRKVSTTQLPKVRISSAAGTVQVSQPQITYLTTGSVAFQQISPQVIGQIQLQSNQTSSSLPVKLISPAQTANLTSSQPMLLQQKKDES